MAGLLVAIGVMGVIMSMLLPVWSQTAKREREAELIFRGEQVMRAIELYQRQYVGAYPDDLETLVEQRFLRRIYKDPMAMNDDGEFRVLYQTDADVGQATSNGPQEANRSRSPMRPVDGSRTFASQPSGGVIGVVSTSDEQSLRLYDGRDTYSEWMFIHAPTSTNPTAAAQREATASPGVFNRTSRGVGQTFNRTPGTSTGRLARGTRSDSTR